MKFEKVMLLIVSAFTIALCVATLKSGGSFVRRVRELEEFKAASIRVINSLEKRISLLESIEGEPGEMPKGNKMILKEGYYIP